MSIEMILVLLAFICFVLATFGVSSRIQLTALGLAFLTLTLLI